MSERAIWSYQGRDSHGWEEGELTVTLTDAGILFEVEEEQAVDSYNSSFNNSCLVPWSEAGPLIAMLAQGIETAEAAETPKEVPSEG